MFSTLANTIAVYVERQGDTQVPHAKDGTHSSSFCRVRICTATAKRPAEVRNLLYRQSPFLSWFRFREEGRLQSWRRLRSSRGQSDGFRGSARRSLWDASVYAKRERVGRTRTTMALVRTSRPAGRFPFQHSRWDATESAGRQPHHDFRPGAGGNRKGISAWRFRRQCGLLLCCRRRSGHQPDKLVFLRDCPGELPDSSSRWNLNK